MVCTTSCAGFGGYKRMLKREKRYTEPVGKKEWSDGGQEHLAFSKWVEQLHNWNRHLICIQYFDAPGHKPTWFDSLN